MKEEKIVEIHLVVRGNVQGVFFRDTTRRFAEELGIVGTVRNVPDGTVEINAQGSQEKLEMLLEKLYHKGPGKIAGIEKEYISPIREYSRFCVVH